jgi:hypothetical protein
MDKNAITQVILGLGKDVRVVAADGGFFFFRGEDENFPFATLITSDRYDQFSGLDRPSVFRLNVGVSRATFRALFGETSADVAPDFTVLNRLMPHPVYGSMFWVSMLKPDEATFEKIRPLLVEAFQRAGKLAGSS